MWTCLVLVLNEVSVAQAGVTEQMAIGGIKVIAACSGLAVAACLAWFLLLLGWCAWHTCFDREQQWWQEGDVGMLCG